jgi:hypothetical protein
MRLDVLHRKIAEDARAIHAAVDTIWTEKIPVAYDGQAVSIKTFINRINRQTEPFGLFNEVHPDKEVSPGLIFNTGLWIDKTELPENNSRAAIRVLWHLNPKNKRIVLTQTEWTRRRYYFWQMVLHELIHCYQADGQPRVYRPRSTQRDTKEQQEYYGSTDEIETHSHAAATELFVWWGHLNYREAAFEAESYSGRTVNPTMQLYANAFASTPVHPALAHFKRKTRQWYTVIKHDPDIYHTLALPNLVT